MPANPGCPRCFSWSGLSAGRMTHDTSCSFPPCLSSFAPLLSFPMTVTPHSLVCANLGLAHALAARFWRNSRLASRLGTIDDVRQEACIALLRAAEGFCPDYRTRDGSPVQFSTYAYSVMIRHLAEVAWRRGIIRLPWHLCGATDLDPGLAEHVRRALHVQQWPLWLEWGEETVYDPP